MYNKTFLIYNTEDTVSQKWHNYYSEQNVSYIYLDAKYNIKNYMTIWMADFRIDITLCILDNTAPII